MQAAGDEKRSLDNPSFKEDFHKFRIISGTALFPYVFNRFLNRGDTQGFFFGDFLLCQAIR
jgi:hypothetical protein